VGRLPAPGDYVERSPGLRACSQEIDRYVGSSPFVHQVDPGASTNWLGSGQRRHETAAWGAPRGQGLASGDPRASTRLGVGYVWVTFAGQANRLGVRNF
jgi:hypothetical protein